MEKFEERYQKLNPQQRKAVDAVEGAVLVVAGPGSGKTEILSLRVANILRKTDAAPSSILCLTFTDSAAATMRRRLASLVGGEAYRVSIGTFHSFAQKVAARYPERFGAGEELETVEEVARLELVREAIEDLPLGDALRTRGHREGEPRAYLRDAVARIQDLKKAGLDAETFAAAAEHCAALLPEMLEILAPLREQRLSTKKLAACAEAAEKLQGLSEKPFPLAGYQDLSRALGRSLEVAVREGEERNSATPVSEWKKRHLERNKGESGPKIQSQVEKLRSLARVYARYQELLARAGLRDFDDRIVDLLVALRQDEDLRGDLQEQYQYILVDEYQDTNGAQAEMLALLADHPANEGNPNLMVVGDDDQAIFRFHGAGIEHILSFAERYPRAEVITMATSYRSRQGILDLAVRHAGDVGERLVGRVPSLSKDLVAGRETGEAAVHVLAGDSREEERDLVAAFVARRLADGVPAPEIAVIGKKHRDLRALVPHMHARNIRVSYERQRNALEDPHVVELLECARVAVAASGGDAGAADHLAPRVLAFPFWKIPRAAIWELAREARANREAWLHAAARSSCEPLRAAAELLLDVALSAHDAPAELLLDQIAGTAETREGRRSPFREHHFNPEARSANPQGVLALVASLRSVLGAFQVQRGGEPLLADFVAFADAHIAHGEPIKTKVRPDPVAVHLLTAHAAKGMEFEVVAILHASTDPWMKPGRASLIRFPENLPISPTSDETDDHLRALYVAMTRAKRELLFACSPAESGKGDPLPIVEGLPALGEDLGPIPEREQLGWARELPPPAADEREVLAPLVENFRLTASALNDFLDLGRGGPQAFLERHVLRFPQYQDDHLRFGVALHRVLERVALGAREGMPDAAAIEAMVREELGRARFANRALEQHLEEGVRAIGTYVAERGSELLGAVHPEYDFSPEELALGEARVTGRVDLVREHEDGTITIVDYKTGRASASWDEKEKEIRNAGNRRQLLFYAVLAKHSPKFEKMPVREAKLVFVRPGRGQEIVELGIGTPDPEEVERVERLARVIHQRVREVNLPDVSGYPQTLEGVRQFEEDLLTGKA